MVFWECVLLAAAVIFAAGGLWLLQSTKKEKKSPLEEFSRRRNGVSCLCMAVLCALAGLWINF